MSHSREKFIPILRELIETEDRLDIQNINKENLNLISLSISTNGRRKELIRRLLTLSDFDFERVVNTYKYIYEDEVARA